MPFAAGILSPRIYLPADIDPGIRSIVLLHEKTHIRRGDLLVKLVTTSMLCLFWFHPPIWISYLLMIRDMESSCDEIVLDETGVERSKYAETLLQFSVSHSGIAAFFGTGNMKERVRSIMNYRKPKTAVTIAVLLVITLASIFLLSDRIYSRKLTLVDNQLNEHSTIALRSTVDYHWPVKDPVVVCNFGEYEGHNGIDVQDRYHFDNNVYACAPGKVVRAGTDENIGHYLVIEHEDGLFSAYFNLDSISVKKGDTVSYDSVGTMKPNHVHLSFLTADNYYVRNIEDLLD